MKRYIPRQGDFVVLTFDPQSGREQRGRRPAFVLSKLPFNRRTGMAICCPITDTKRKSPFHVAVPPGSTLTGFIMIDQVKSVDFRSRQVRFVNESDEDTLDEVLAILDAVLYD